MLDEDSKTPRNAQINESGEWLWYNSALGVKVMCLDACVWVGSFDLGQLATTPNNLNVGLCD